MLIYFVESHGGDNIRVRGVAPSADACQAILKVQLLLPEAAANDKPRIVRAQVPTKPSTKGPVFKKRLLPTWISFWKGDLVPEPDTIGKYLTPFLRLCKAYGYGMDQTIDWMKERLSQLQTKSFSDRLQTDPAELYRCDLGYTARAIWECNGYQPDAQGSAEIFDKVVAHCRNIGFEPLEPASWSNWGRAKTKKQRSDWSLYDDELTFEEKLACKEKGCKLLRCDSRTLYAIVNRLKTWIRQIRRPLASYQAAKITSEFYPWKLSENRRCKRMERLLALLKELGLLKVERRAWYFGKQDSRNQGTSYAWQEVRGNEQALPIHRSEVNKQIFNHLPSSNYLLPNDNYLAIPVSIHNRDKVPFPESFIDTSFLCCHQVLE